MASIVQRMQESINNGCAEMTTKADRIIAHDTQPNSKLSRSPIRHIVTSADLWSSRNVPPSQPSAKPLEAKTAYIAHEQTDAGEQDDTSAGNGGRSAMISGTLQPVTAIGVVSIQPQGREALSILTGALALLYAFKLRCTLCDIALPIQVCLSSLNSRIKP